MYEVIYRTNGLYSVFVTPTKAIAERELKALHDAGFATTFAMRNKKGFVCGLLTVYEDVYEKHVNIFETSIIWE